MNNLYIYDYACVTYSVHCSEANIAICLGTRAYIFSIHVCSDLILHEVVPITVYIYLVLTHVCSDLILHEVVPITVSCNDPQFRSA